MVQIQETLWIRTTDSIFLTTKRIQQGQILKLAIFTHFIALLGEWQRRNRTDNVSIRIHGPDKHKQFIHPRAVLWLW
jgi:hypothetical protein